MKIQKIALSILAIAISSSAFASSYPEQIQKHKEEIQAKLNSSSYDAVTENAAQNIYDGLKGSSNSSDPKDARMLVLIKSNGNSAYTYKVYSEQESKAVQDLSEKLSKLGLSDDVIYTTIKAQLDESRKDFGHAAQFNDTANIAREGFLGSFLLATSEVKKFQDAKSSLRVAQADSIKHIIEGNLNNDGGEKVWGYKAKIDNSGSITEFVKSDVDTSLYGDFVKHLWGVSDSQMLRQLQNVPNIGEGAIELAAEYKEKENAKAISEFNALQEIALKEPDLAVKALIKQAADLKLASYKK